MKKILIIVFCILTSCGYQPLYVNKEISQMTFNQVQITGDKRINNRVTSALSIIEKKDENLNNLFIDSEEIILETSKDSKGLVNTYKTNIKLTFVYQKDNTQACQVQFGSNLIPIQDTKNIRKHRNIST